MNNLQFFAGTTNDVYKRFDGGNTTHFILFNDHASNSLQFSFDGQNTKGVILPGEGIEFLDVQVNTIHLKNYVTGNDCIYRLWFTGEKVQLDAEGNKIETSQRSEVPRYFARTRAVR